MTARLLGDKDLHIIRAYDKRPPAVQEEQLEEVRGVPSPSFSVSSLAPSGGSPPILSDLADHCRLRDHSTACRTERL